MRQNTEELYRAKVNRVIDYIGANLHRPLQLDKIAESMHVSPRQLLRIIHSALDEPLAAYVARQRVERAVLYLQTRKSTLSDLAAMVGYDNAQSFSKAFKKQYGISPKVYADKLQSRLREAMKERGVEKLSAEIRTEGELELVYIRIFGQYGAEEPYEMGWNKLTAFLKAHDALNEFTRFIGLSFDDPHVTRPEHCRFYACAAVARPVTPSGEFGTLRLPGGKYAVYTLRGDYSGLQELYNRISLGIGYPLRYGMPFEEYLIHSKEHPEEQITKVYIPIK